MLCVGSDVREMVDVLFASIAIGIGIGAAYLASKYTNDVVTQQTADLYDRKGWFSGW